jgi:diguanylate cyclase (GGDEF)-like protein/PAS domain S-box-containing protein
MTDEKTTLSAFEVSADTFKALLNRLEEGVCFADHEKKILFWNKAAEKMSGHTEQEVLGKCCSDHILMHLDEHGTILCGDRCPASECLADGRPREFSSSLLHKEGYRVSVYARLLPRRDNSGKIIGIAQVFSDISPRVSMPPKPEDLERLNLLDLPTELGNRRFLEIYLEARIEEMRKYDLPLGLLFVDIDDLAKVNEAYGHFVGDRVVRIVAKALASNIRFTDVAGRWEEDRFLVILLNAGEPKLDVVANKLRLLIQGSGFEVDGSHVGVTISIGTAEARKHDTAASLIDRARKRMQYGKSLGKNQVCSSLPDEF